MPKSTEEMLQTLEELIDEYSAFQRGRPDLPHGNLVDLSQDELEQIVDAFQQHKSQLDERPERTSTASLIALQLRASGAWLGRRSITGNDVFTALAPNRFKDFWR
jgi:hypothetical protein